MITAKNIKRLSLFLFGLMLIALSFGESITLFSFSLSWIFAGVISSLMAFHMLISSTKKNESRNKHANKALIFAVVWGLYSALQFLWANDMTLWKQGMVSTLVNIFIIVVLWYFIEDGNDIDSFLKYSIPLWAVNIGLGLYEALTNNHFMPSNVVSENGSFVRTFFGNPNDYATWMTLSFLLLSFYIKRRKIHEIFTLIAWGLTLFVVSQTDSRACIYGMIVYAIVYIAYYVFVRLEGKTSSGVFKTLFWVFTGVLIAILIFFGIYGDLGSSLILNFSDGSNQTSDLDRLEIMKDTLKVTFNSLFIGVGANQTISYIGINPHNFFLELLADFGIIIFLFACYTFFKIINTGLNKHESSPVRAFYLAYAITFFIISISSSSMNRLRLTWVSLVIVFIAACCSRPNEEKENTQKVKKHKNKWVK